MPQGATLPVLRSTTWSASIITARHRCEHILHKAGRDESARRRAPKENADRAVSPLSGQHEAFG